MSNFRQGFRECRQIEQRNLDAQRTLWRRARVAAVVFVVVMIALVFASGYVLGDTHTEPPAPQEMNERVMLAQVQRGACCVIVGGGVIITPTPTVEAK